MADHLLCLSCQVKLGEKEQGGPEDSEELITVDAVGCFEDEDDEDEDEEIGQEEDSVAGQQDAEEPVSKQVCGFTEKGLYGERFPQSTSVATLGDRISV